MLKIFEKKEQPLTHINDGSSSNNGVDNEEGVNKKEEEKEG
jgi:hypothetical protein